MRKLLTLALLCVSTLGYCTTTVSGNLKTLATTAVSSRTYVRFYLRGCAGNQPRVNGTALIPPTGSGVWYVDMTPDGTGAISGTLYSTRDAAGTGAGEIQCGTSSTAYTSVWYGMVIVSNGNPGPEVPVHAKNTVALNVNSVTPITAYPTSSAGIAVAVDTDGTLAANSDALVATQKATKTYVDTFAATKQDSLGYTAEDVASKSTSTSLGTSNTLYPSQNAVKGYVDAAVATKADSGAAGVSGYTAEFTGADSITPIAVTGTDNYVKSTSPEITTPSILYYLLLSTPLGTNAPYIDCDGGHATAPTGGVAHYLLYCDLSTHSWMVKMNNDTALSLLTSGNLDTDGTMAANSDSKVATQKATKTYADNAVSTASKVAASVALPAGTTGNISKTALYAPLGDGAYRFSCQVVETQAATSSSTMPACKVYYTNPITGGEGVIGLTSIITTNVVGVMQQGSAYVYQKSGAAISYETSGYVSSGATPMQYVIYVTLEKLP